MNFRTPLRATMGFMVFRGVVPFLIAPLRTSKTRKEREEKTNHHWCRLVSTGKTPAEQRQSYFLASHFYKYCVIPASFKIYSPNG